MRESRGKAKLDGSRMKDLGMTPILTSIPAKNTLAALIFVYEQRDNLY
jgi:hypothetical protein